jgi:phosphinothricin acetyltransferase
MGMEEGRVVVRSRLARDLPAITEIYAREVRLGTASFELEAPDLAEMQRRAATIAAGHYPYLVAELDAEVAGYAYASIYRSRPGYRFTVENSVYIRPELRGRGIGGQLLRALVAAAGARGFRQMIAVIGDSANVASIRLHEQAGFHLVGVHANVGWKNGRWLDTVMMQRALGPGADKPA